MNCFMHIPAAHNGVPVRAETKILLKSVKVHTPSKKSGNFAVRLSDDGNKGQDIQG